MISFIDMTAHSLMKPVETGFSVEPFLDPAIINALGDYQTIVSVEPSGASHWGASTARITAKNNEGQLHHYFAKVLKGELAMQRILGEFNCALELYKTMPSIVPTPRAHARCSDSDSHFLLCDFVEIDHRQPDASKVAEKMAKLHQVSASPTGRFGFHVTPYDGKLPLKVDWDSSWTSLYTKLLSEMYVLDVQVNGEWQELDSAMKVMVEKVIPRLLRPLEEDGRSIKPCLIHGDLWETNVGTVPSTGEIYIFDSCAYYAHHEMALGMWRVTHHNMYAPEYREEYLKHYPPDEPRDEFDDRNRLYSLKETMTYSAHKPGHEVRAQVLEDMQYLIAKFA